MSIAFLFSDQIREKANRLPALTGFGAAVLARLFFSVDRMLIPAMILMTALFLIFRKKYEVRTEGKK